jgi:hypothetical protein
MLRALNELVGNLAVVRDKPLEFLVVFRCGDDRLAVATLALGGREDEPSVLSCAIEENLDALLTKFEMERPHCSPP